MRTTFWPQQNTGVRYVRCELPARELGARILEFHTERHKEDPLGEQRGVGVWQMVMNRMRLNAMRESRERFGATILEVDDDYTVWHEKYVAMMPGAKAKWMAGMPADTDLSTSSVALHRVAAEEADAVIVSTPYLADRYRELNGNVHVCPNSVEPADWPKPEERDSTIRVIFSGTPSMDDKRVMREPMEWVAARDGATATVFGADPDWRGVRHVPYEQSLMLYRKTLVGERPDVGLRPIDDNPFGRAKSDLKVLEYAMAGAMSIVSPLQPYQAWTDGPVRFAGSRLEWLSQVRWAVEHPVETRELAAETREIVLRERTIEQTIGCWREALESVSVAV